ncbi:MAG: ABC transporter ATP-binding protein [Gammaproteobacteria bacterium]|nr:ABC transporter ATP-binding protein [Gammaproteobacteria bacterium]
MTALSIRNLTKVYANGFQALKGIDLDVAEGGFYALLGPNGAGKSTTIGIVTSLVNKTAGSVKVFGHDIDQELEQAKACIGLVPQELNFNQFEEVLPIILNQAGYYGVPRKIALERAEFYLRKLDLWDQRELMSQRLSGGMKRRLMIARALVHEPRLLILDEPTAGVDLEIRRSMWKFLREINAQGTTIILTTHYLEEAETLCRNVGIINNGEIIKNTDMKTLLSELDVETFVLMLRQPLQDNSILSPFNGRQTDENTIELDLPRSESLNRIFQQLSANNLEVVSVRTRENPLEALFMGLVGIEETPLAALSEAAGAAR